MKVSLNWLKSYLDISLNPEEIGDILTEIGLEVEGMDEMVSIPGGLEGLVVGEVIECGKHPNADKLSLTKVNVGGEEPLQIVCGAPNVGQGQKVVVATIGTLLYPTEGEPFKIKKGKIRGEVSEGMICAEDEIGLGKSHDGIMVLPAEIAVGTPASEYFNIEKDLVYEIGLTPNRSDATCHIGVAEDLVAALMTNYGHSGDIDLPDVSAFAVANNDAPVEIIVEDPAACPRYTGVSLTQVEVKESPEWIKNRLNSIGVRPINNVLDITNYVLHEFGQPLHAFDLDKVAGQKIIVKTLPAGTKFLSLDEKERELNAEDLMICDGDSKGMCIAGVFGGMNSGVTEGTTRVFLESAHFNPTFIRRTSMRHVLRTDAAKVYEKGSDPNVTEEALKRAVLLLQEYAGAVVSSEVTDLYPTPVEPVRISVAYEYVNRLMGVDIAPEDVRRILAAMKMEIIADADGVFTVSVPTNKSDVKRPADVVEEIVRIYGLNKIAIPAQIKTSLNVAPNPDPHRVFNTVADYLSANGFNEMMAVSLSQSRYYEEIFPMDKNQLVFVNNTSNSHLDIMRPDMLFSGLEAIVQNQNRQRLDLRLYEYGRTYLKSENGYDETRHLSIFLTGKAEGESWRRTKQMEVDFFSLKTFVNNVLAKLGVQGYQESSSDSQHLAMGLCYHRGPQQLVHPLL
ncbi:MAG: phenylalanine--tRNA ligase subunit beta, partial [Bacteroidota bacterium]